jgi:phage tail P2-like protein
MSDDPHDLLPSSVSPLERELARLSRHLDAVDPAVIETLWDASTCPAILLPHLAWALSLDVWDDAWPEATKRQAIAEAPAIHRLKGTRSAVDRVMRLLGCRVVIQEWWQQQPQGRRGTSRATVYVLERFSPDAPMITARLVQQVRRALSTTKPKSRPVTLTMGVAVGGRVAVAAAAQALQVGVMTSAITTPRRGQSSVSVAAAAQALHISQVNSVASLPRAGRARLSAAVAAQTVQISRFGGVAKHRSMR